MSTDNQPLSIENQKKLIAEYAAAHGVEIVKTYSDEGKSGLTLRKRDAMQQLLRDVMDPQCPFKSILVLDVSRWGRFQDVDESAYYEYHCRKNGVQVIYVGEPFPETSGPMDALLKHLKRVMAAEYSRELAAKVRAGQERVVRLGFVAGMPPCVGFRRQAVAADGTPKKFLEDGERKPLPTDRVRWVHSSEAEIAILRRIFHDYTLLPKTQHDIANDLNAEGLLNRQGKPFTWKQINHLLKCDLVTGVHVWGRKKAKPGHPASKQIRVEGILPALIDQSTWDRAQKKRRTRWRYTPEVAAEMLRAAREKKMKPDEFVKTLKGIPTTQRRNFFGTLQKACKTIGLDWNAQVGSWKRNRTVALSTVHLFCRDVAILLGSHGAKCKRIRSCTTLTVGKFALTVKVMRPVATRAGLSWCAPDLSTSPNTAWRLFMRLNVDGLTGRDFYLVPPAESHRVPRKWINAQHLESLAQFRIADSTELLRRLMAAIEEGARWPAAALEDATAPVRTVESAHAGCGQQETQRPRIRTRRV